MKKEAALVFFILSLNIGTGYLFQLSNGITCLTELAFIGFGGLVFWLGLYHPLKRFTTQLLLKSGLQQKSVLTLGGMGVVASVLNLFFCQFFLMTSFALLFGCVSPSFDTLTASLTNNMAGNLLCYMGLVGMIIHDNRTSSSRKEKETKSPLDTTNRSILLSHHKALVNVSIREISHIQVSNNAITIFADGKKFVKYQSLKSFQAVLPNSLFKRVHRSTVVNVEFIEKIIPNPNGDGRLLLRGGLELRYSRSYNAFFK